MESLALLVSTRLPCVGEEPTRRMRVNAEAVQKASDMDTVLRNVRLMAKFPGCVNSKRMRLTRVRYDSVVQV